MRILLALPNDNDTGGVVSVVQNLAKYLTSRGHDVLFLNASDGIFIRAKPTKLGCPGFDLRMQSPFGDRHPTISILAFLFFFPIGMYQIVRLVRRHRIDVINIHYPADCLFYFALCRRILGIGLITSVHGADVFPNGTLHNGCSRALRFIFSSSDLIVAPSRNFQRMFLTAFPEFKTKTAFVHNGVDLAELDDISTSATDGKQAPYVFCISAYKEQKAIDVLIRAFKLVRNADPTVTLTIAGPGPLREELEQLAVSLGIREQIEFLGVTGRDDVVRLLRGCKAFVLPSRFETFGIVILEAMACKKPVVATTAGGIPEIIENGQNGILVEPNDPKGLAEALVKLLKDESLQRITAMNGYATVRERFTFEETGRKYIRAFAAVSGTEKTVSTH